MSVLPNHGERFERRCTTCVNYVPVQGNFGRCLLGEPHHHTLATDWCAGHQRKKDQAPRTPGEATSEKVGGGEVAEASPPPAVDPQSDAPVEVVSDVGETSDAPMQPAADAQLSATTIGGDMEDQV